MWYESLKYYYSHKYDRNCIKKHPRYLTGKFQGKIVKPIALDKAKVAAKKLDCTFNDLVLGIISKALKLYFKEKGDDSSYVTISVPYSLNTVPNRVEDYKACNSFASLYVYLDLEEDLKTACLKAAK